MRSFHSQNNFLEKQYMYLQFRIQNKTSYLEPHLLVQTVATSHHSDVIMGAMASQISGVSIVYLNICSGADQIKHQSSASPAFVNGIHRWSVNSPHKGPVTRKMLPFDDVIMSNEFMAWISSPPKKGCHDLSMPNVLNYTNHRSVKVRAWINNCIHRAKSSVMRLFIHAWISDQ